MKNKICIYTLTDLDNYGNRLQNFALQKYLEKRGYHVDTLRRQKTLNIVTVLYFIKVKLLDLIDCFKYKTNIFTIYKERKKNFYFFHDNYISTVDFSLKNTDINQKYDFFIAGSDQIWNYKFAGLNTKDFLSFADYDKTISYAASFGVETIEDNWKDFYEKNLNHIKNISVREISGCSIVKDLTGRDATLVLDPTLLLDKNDYRKVFRKPSFKLPKKYILTFFLGKLDPVKRKEIESLAMKNNLEIIYLNDKNNLEYYKVGPAEFLYLFSNATIIFTDSFHGSVFSFLFDRTFYTFKRNSRINMNTRLESLFKLLQLENHSISSIKEVDNIFEHDYNISFKILDKIRKESYDFLDKSLNNR